MSSFKLGKTIGFALVMMVTAQAQAQTPVEQLWHKVSSMQQANWNQEASLSEAEFVLLQQLAKKGDANAQYALGSILMAQHNHAQAAAWLKHAAEQGHAPARYSYNSNAAGHSDMAMLSW